MIQEPENNIIQIKFLIQQEKISAKNSVDKTKKKAVDQRLYRIKGNKDNFYEIFLLIQPSHRMNKSLNDLLEIIRQQVRDNDFLTSFLKGPLIFLNRSDSFMNTYSQLVETILNPDDILNRSLGKYLTKMETIAIEICPRYVHLLIIFDMIGSVHQKIKPIQFDRYISDYFNDIVRNQYQKKIGQGYIFHELEYLDIYSEWEKIEDNFITRKHQVELLEKSLYCVDVLQNIVFERSLYFQLMNLNANFHKKIQITITFKKPRSVEQFITKGADGLHKSGQAMLDSIIPSRRQNIDKLFQILSQLSSGYEQECQF